VIPILSQIPIPEAPSFAVDWEAIDARFEWVRAMRGCPQDAKHHAEGDVWIHTRMVVEALAAMPAWRALDDEGRALVFTAALLHDVGKPDRTKTDADGRISSRGHSTHGALLARRILWRLGAPFAFREAVCAIIRSHQVPFFLVDRADAKRTAVAISQTARCDHLALVAEADARGRICADQQRIVDNVALFRELCDELGCLRAPAPFPSSHARVLYFRGDSDDPTYRPHEAFTADVVLMCGLPGAGKNTWIDTNLTGWPVVSLDAIRAEMRIPPVGPQGEVVARARELAREHLRAGRAFVWNATSLTRPIRNASIALFLGYGARVRVAYVEVPEPVLRAQNRGRAARVPDVAIDRLLAKWEVPDATEAHEVTYAIT